MYIYIYAYGTHDARLDGTGPRQDRARRAGPPTPRAPRDRDAREQRPTCNEDAKTKSQDGRIDERQERAAFSAPNSCRSSVLLFIKRRLECCLSSNAAVPIHIHTAVRYHATGHTIGSRTTPNLTDTSSRLSARAHPQDLSIDRPYDHCPSVLSQSGDGWMHQRQDIANTCARHRRVGSCAPGRAATWEVSARAYSYTPQRAYLRAAHPSVHVRDWLRCRARHVAE